jgi:hypothetical protein
MTPYNQMPLFSRVWVYQAEREFTTEEVNELEQKAGQFVSGWTAHNQQLKACFEIRYNRFIIFVVDEEMALASGCSVDKSVHFIKTLEQEYKTSLLNRMIFTYKLNEQVKSCTKNKFEQLLSEGVINGNTIVFNNLVTTKDELDKNWEVPLKDSWHKQLFMQT